MKTTVNSAKFHIILSMLIFGTIGIFVRHIPLPSSVIALVRGVVGTLFLLIFSRFRKTPVSREAIRRNLKVLILSGIAIGFNWILLFEAYRYTTVATATLCYYLAPVFVILVSPLLFKEALTLRKLCCIAAALIGMVFVSGVLETDFSGSGEFLGIVFGVGAAVLYASVVLMNKMLADIQVFDRTIVQLAAAASWFSCWWWVSSTPVLDTPSISVPSRTCPPKRQPCSAISTRSLPSSSLPCSWVKALHFSVPSARYWYWVPRCSASSPCRQNETSKHIKGLLSLRI